MNQILNIPNKITKYLFFFKILLSLSIIIITVSLICMFYLNYQNNTKAEISNLMLTSYTISKLYSNTVFSYEEPSSPYIIGTLEIPSISLNLPIISEMNDELLSISACRFYGPMPNRPR